MKITTLIAAAALATASTAAIADVTTDAGELVMIEKNQASIVPALIPGIVFSVVAIVVASTGS